MSTDLNDHDSVSNAHGTNPDVLRKDAIRFILKTLDHMCENDDERFVLDRLIRRTASQMLTDAVQICDVIDNPEP